MLRQILINEIKAEIGHEPTEKELQVFIDYIEGTMSDMEKDGKRMNVTDLEEAVRDCRKDYFAQCEECEEWFLIDDDWNELEHCCRECRPYVDPDMMPGGHDYY